MCSSVWMVGYQIYKNEKWDCNNYPFREQTAHVISESAGGWDKITCAIICMQSCSTVFLGGRRLLCTFNASWRVSSTERLRTKLYYINNSPIKYPTSGTCRHPRSLEVCYLNLGSPPSIAYPTTMNVHNNLLKQSAIISVLLSIGLTASFCGVSFAY